MPSWLVTNSFVSPVSTLLSVTLAPATTAPEVSATVPRISPVFLLWERTGLATLTTRQNASAKRNNPFIESSTPEIDHPPCIATLRPCPTSACQRPDRRRQHSLQQRTYF